MLWAYSPETCDLIPTKFLQRGRPMRGAVCLFLGEDGIYLGRWRSNGDQVTDIHQREITSGPYETLTDAKFAAELLFG